MSDFTSDEKLVGRFYCVWGSHFDTVLGLNYFQDPSSTYNPATGWNANNDSLGPGPYDAFGDYEDEHAIIGDHALPGGKPGSFAPRIPNRTITTQPSHYRTSLVPSQVLHPENGVYGRNGSDYEGHEIEHEDDEDEKEAHKASSSNDKPKPDLHGELPTSALKSMGLWTNEARAAFRLGLRAAVTPGGLTGMKNAYSRGPTPMPQQTPGMAATSNYFPRVQTSGYAAYQNTAGHTPYSHGVPVGNAATPSSAVGSFGVASQQSGSSSSVATPYFYQSETSPFSESCISARPGHSSH